MGVKVDMHGIMRSPDGHVHGWVQLIWEEDILGKHVKPIDNSEQFDLPQNGEQQVFTAELPSIDVGIVKISVTARVKVFEKPGANQVCVQGHIEASGGPVTLGHDLDENCHPIPI